MLTLYYSPGSISLTIHIVLRELKIPHKLVLTPTGKNAHKEPGYLALNPRGRVPALVLEGGEVLTEVTAILGYLSALSPGLMPTDPLARARCDEAMSVMATGMQPAFRLLIRPDRVVPGAEDYKPISAAGRAEYLELMGLMDTHHWQGPWLLGESFTVADIYLFVLFTWGMYIGVDPSGWSNLPKWAGRIGQRPAVVHALMAESLIDKDGRITPPKRV